MIETARGEWPEPRRERSESHHDVRGADQRLLADEFLDIFDGFHRLNDLTQLTLGLDRDSGIVAHLFDERDPAVKKLLSISH